MNHYQINLRSIANAAPRTPFEALRETAHSSSDAPSPLAVVTAGLDLLQDLGIELLHIMPPFCMGQESRKGIGSPYAVADYLNIDPEFGTKEEWFELVRQAHRRDMKVILGFMPNHTARDHVWVSEDPDHHVRDEQGHPAFDFDWSDTAKLNYHSPRLCRTVIDTLCYWLKGGDEESGVDGYRMDMAHMINDLSFWDRCIPELEAASSLPLLLMAECYGLERNVDLFHRGFHAAYDDDFYKIAQYGYARNEHGRSVLLLDPEAEHNQDFAPRLREWREGGIAKAVLGLIQEYQTRAPDHLLARYVDNHDEGRGVYRFGKEASSVMMDLAACMPQTILFTLAGQEAGAMNRPPIHEYFSICDKGFRKVEGDQVRVVDGIEFEGNQFFRTPEERTESISEYRKRFHLRLEHPALTRGGWAAYEVGEQAAENQKSVVAFLRDDEDETLFCLFNLGHHTRVLSHLPEGTRLYGKELHDQVMEPFSSLVLRVKTD